MSSLRAHNRNPKEHLLSHKRVQQESCTALLAAWFASHPNDGWAVVETWARAADVLQARPELKPGPVHGRAKVGVGKGNVAFSKPRALRRQRAGHGDADSRERLHVPIHGVAAAHGGPRGVRGAWFRDSRRTLVRSPRRS